MQILLVDDDRSSRRLLDAILSKMGYIIRHAEDGVEAWEIIQSEKINFVLSDWRMPRMDGIELCQKLRNSHQDYYTYVVLFTGLDQQDDLIIALQAGADDFLTKPVNARELEARILAGKRVLALEETLITQNKQLEEVNLSLKQSQKRIQQDLEAAAKIQRDLLPESPLQGYPIKMAWDYLPAEELAGDMFHFFAIDDDHIGFYLADVAGHGVPAAMLSVHIAKSLSAESREDSLVRLNENELNLQKSNNLSKVKQLFKTSDTSQKSYREPKEVAQKLNEHFKNDADSMLYFTMVYGVLNTQSGEGSFCQAGHPYPLLIKSSGEVEKLGKGGMPIGLMEDATYNQIDFSLNQGDRLFMYSDGITECENECKEQFGYDRLSNILIEHRTEDLTVSILKIKENLAQWYRSQSEKLHLEDDASMLMIEYK